jgi:hypothetical protein
MPFMHPVAASCGKVPDRVTSHGKPSHAQCSCDLQKWVQISTEVDANGLEFTEVDANERVIPLLLRNGMVYRSRRDNL